MNEFTEKKLLAKKRSGVSTNVYLILKQNNEILLQLRKNTGYCDGYWGLVAGHVEDDEAATEALIREAREEIGIQISLSDLKLAHVMHRKTNRFNIDLFFDCTSWKGPIENQETEKCEKLDFFSLQDLPVNTIEYIKDALQNILKGEVYSEQGWNE